MLRSFPEIWLLGGAALALVTLGACPDGWMSASSDLALVQHLTREIPRGHLSGVFPGRRLPITKKHLEPGDIIVCHNPKGGYGYWTHAVMYIGHGEAVDSNDFVRGTIRRPLSAYSGYQEVAVLRIAAPRAARVKAAQAALKDVGKPYDPFSPSRDAGGEYCSKLVWESFHNEGVDLCQRHRWIVPDDIVHSPNVNVIQRWPQA